MGMTWRRGDGHIVWTSKIVKRWRRRRTSYRDGGGHIWRKGGGNRKLEEVEDSLYPRRRRERGVLVEEKVVGVKARPRRALTVSQRDHVRRPRAARLTYPTQ